MSASSPERQVLVLRLLNGEQAGRCFTLLEGKNILGRATEARISIDDRRASREHAAIYVQGPQYLLVDKNSTNGTFVNDQLVRKVTLHAGDRLRVGNSYFAVEDFAYSAPRGRHYADVVLAPALRHAREATLPQRFEDAMPDWRERRVPSNAMRGVLWGLAAALAGSLIWTNF